MAPSRAQPSAPRSALLLMALLLLLLLPLPLPLPPTAMVMETMWMMLPT